MLSVFYQLMQLSIYNLYIQGKNNSSLNVFDDGAVLLGSVIWTLSIALMFFKPQHFKGWFFPRPQVKHTLSIELACIGGPLIEASLIDWTQQSGFHLRTREEPSLETLWFKKHKGNG
jgi:hypothetical protein